VRAAGIGKQTVARSEHGATLARACAAEALAVSRPRALPALPTAAELGEILAR